MPSMILRIAMLLVAGSNDGIMSLSFTNQSLEPEVSASDSSSFICPHCNLEKNTHSKVKRYDIGEDSSDGENEWSSSDEHVSSVVCGSQSITPKPIQLNQLPSHLLMSVGSWSQVIQ
jgi:hypothetical protein